MIYQQKSIGQNENFLQSESRPRHLAWKNSCDSLAVVGLHESWTLAPMLGEGFTTPDNVQKKELFS